MLTRIENILNRDDLQQIASLTATAQWQSGHHSAGAHASDAKINQEMHQGGDSWKAINQLVVSKLYQHPEFQRAALPSKVSAAFVSRYSSGMQYQPHVDDPVMGSAAGRYRSDVAITVFLSDKDSYTGGELRIHTRFGAVDVKLDAGSAVTYPASSLHEVTQITSGERLACVLWAQSLVRSAEQREILSDLDEARQALHMSAKAAQVTDSVDRAYTNLLRMWSEV
ncbi:MAG: Fe2+-dependent dioxygenase [Pseudomonadota bacterium]